MKTALVTGSNRGLGLETAKELGQKGFKVIVATRKLADAKTTAKALKKDAPAGEYIPLQIDVSKEASIKKALKFLKTKKVNIDVLVNNAGVISAVKNVGRNKHDGELNADSVFSTPAKNILKTLEVNTIGAYLLCQALIPGMMKRKFGRVVNVSSGMGQLDEMEGGHAGYRISKTALNAVTRIFHSESGDNNVLVNTLCPGWVRTRMGGKGAERPVEKGAETIVWLATLEDGGPSGKFFRDMQQIPW